jgi:hypothetical protein
MTQVLDDLDTRHRRREKFVHNIVANLSGYYADRDDTPYIGDTDSKQKHDKKFLLRDKLGITFNFIQDFRETEPFAIKHPTTAFLDRVYELQNQDDLDGGVDYIFSVLNKWLGRGEFELTNATLVEVDENRLGSDLALSFLTITRAARDKLPSRSEYLARAHRRISQLRGDAVADKLLRHMAD